MTILTPTSGGSIRIPTSGNVYTLRPDANVYRNGARMAATARTALVAWTPTPNLIYRKDALGVWRSWDGAAWRVVAAPPVMPARPVVTLSRPTTTSLMVTITEVPDADGYHVQWRDPKRGPTWKTA